MAGSATLEADRLAEASKANRSFQRAAPTPTTSTKSTSPPKPKSKPKPKAPAPMPKIAGLTANQVKNAWAIVKEGHSMGISQRGQQIAVATAMQESNLENLTYAVDHDSLGLFQQRPSSGWGTPKQLTNPAYAAHAFYAVLVTYKGAWGCLTCAAQDVQRSAYPGAYAKHSSSALRVVQALDKRF